MKMTKLEWNYLRKIALDHPFYDTHKPPLTDAEAEAIMRANNAMTGKEFVDSVYAKCGMTRPPERKKRFPLLSGIGELLSVPPIRRIAIAVFVFILLTVFFAATPVGRTIAEEATQFVVRLFGREMTVIPEEMIGSEAVSEAKPELPSAEYDVNRNADPREGIAMFTGLTGREPLVLEGLTMEKVLCCPDGSETLITVYRTENGGMVFVNEMWNPDVAIYFISDGVFRTMPDCGDLYCAVDESDSTLTYVALLPDSIVHVFLNGDVDRESVLSALLDYTE